MSIKDFIKDKLSLLFLNTIFIIILIFYLGLFDIPSLAVYFLCIIWSFMLLIYFVFSYFKRNDYYKELNTIIEDNSIMHITDLLDEPTFADGKPFYSALELMNYTFSEELSRYSKQNVSYQEYIERWVHEIKTPIASLKLIIETEKDSLGKIAIEELQEIQKIENYIDQTLYYSRMEYSQNDYFVSEFPIMKVVKQVILKNQNQINRSNISLNIKNSGETVFSDEKWLVFMINQILLNAIKYSKKDNAIISINVDKSDTYISLNIIDNGIGIAAEDLPRIFSKGFTGNNGRIDEKSTGLGLFLVNELCTKLDHKITIDSIQNEYTKVSIIFPKSNYKDTILNKY